MKSFMPESRQWLSFSFSQSLIRLASVHPLINHQHIYFHGSFSKWSELNRDFSFFFLLKRKICLSDLSNLVCKLHFNETILTRAVRFNKSKTCYSLLSSKFYLITLPCIPRSLHSYWAVVVVYQREKYHKISVQNAREKTGLELTSPGPPSGSSECVAAAAVCYLHRLLSSEPPAGGFSPPRCPRSGGSRCRTPRPASCCWPSWRSCSWAWPARPGPPRCPRSRCSRWEEEPWGVWSSPGRCWAAGWRAAVPSVVTAPAAEI